MEEQNKSYLERLGYLFYVASPNRTSFATFEEVPNYVIEVIPFFFGFACLEACILCFKKRKNFSINDSFGSISQGMMEELVKIFTKSIELAAYVYIYNNWRLTTLPWDSAWTWFLCFLGTDLAYYWLHRASHEINILWAAHQVHHSSEYYNLTTALRQSVLQYLSVWMFYLPMAFAIPPSVFLVHNQLNLLYQFWIHTELINTTGPLEYILNTPSHHRVHHGRNRYCIDKNYAGVLIIWDRMFGTFEPENEEVVYGLTHPINTFSPFQIQLSHYMHIWRTFWSTNGFREKLSVIFKGPGWEPGKPWHGCIEDIPDVHAPMEKYDPKIPSWCTAYALVHFSLIFLGYIEITEGFCLFTQTAVLLGISYQILSFIALAAIFDGKASAPYLELLRCSLFLIIDFYFLPQTRLGTLSNSAMLVCQTLLRTCFICSTLLWLTYCVTVTSVRLSTKKIE